MKSLLALLLLPTLLVCETEQAPVDSGVRKATLVRVIDGDTLVLNIELGDAVVLYERHVRLYDVHAFEHTTEVGRRESIALRDLFSDSKKPVAIELKGRDKYGRMLGVVWCGDTNVNKVMKSMPQGGR